MVYLEIFTTFHSIAESAQTVDLELQELGIHQGGMPTTQYVTHAISSEIKGSAAHCVDEHTELQPTGVWYNAVCAESK